MKFIPLVLIAFVLVGCVSAETQKALDAAQARLEAIQGDLDDVRIERAELAAKLDSGILSAEDFQSAMENLLAKVRTLDVEEAVATKEVAALEEKAQVEKDASTDWALELAGTTVDLGSSVALPFAPWLIPILGQLGAAIAGLRKKKEEE